MRNTITRTFNTVFATVLVYKDGKVNTCELALPDFCTLPVAAEKYIRRHSGIIDGNLITVDSLKTVSELFGMEESDFIKYATPVAVRGKDTRDKITKTVNAFKGTLVYMDIVTREVKTREVNVPADMKNKLDKYARTIEQDGEKAIMIENLVPIASLYAMSEQDFKAKAKRMVDHQHYVE